MYEFMASQRSNGHGIQEESSDEDFSEIDEESNEGRYPVDCMNFKGFRFIAFVVLLVVNLSKSHSPQCMSRIKCCGFVLDVVFELYACV